MQSSGEKPLSADQHGGGDHAADSPGVGEQLTAWRDKNSQASQEFLHRERKNCRVRADHVATVTASPLLRHTMTTTNGLVRRKGAAMPRTYRSRRTRLAALTGELRAAGQTWAQ